MRARTPALERKSELVLATLREHSALRLTPSMEDWNRFVSKERMVASITAVLRWSMLYDLGKGQLCLMVE